MGVGSFRCVGGDVDDLFQDDGKEGWVDFMSPSNMISSNMAIWIVNGLMALILTLVGFSANREIKRDDEQELRIRAVEQVCVEVRIMRSDISEIKGDIKTLVRKP